MVLGLSCDNCKLVIHKQYQHPTQLRFKYCPNCGQEATTLDNYNDITDQENAYLMNMKLDIYRYFRDLYSQHIRNRNGYHEVSFRQFVKKTLQEALTTL